MSRKLSPAELAEKRKKAEAWVKGYSATAVASVLAVAFLQEAEPCSSWPRSYDVYHIGGIYRHDWTEGDGVAAASTIGLAAVAGKIAAMEAAILLGPRAFREAAICRRNCLVDGTTDYQYSKRRRRVGLKKKGLTAAGRAFFLPGCRLASWPTRKLKPSRGRRKPRGRRQRRPKREKSSRAWAVITTLTAPVVTRSRTMSLWSCKKCDRLLTRRSLPLANNSGISTLATANR